MEYTRKVPELKSIIGWDSKVLARVRLAAHHAIMGSGSFSLSTVSSLEYCLLSSCLLIHGCKRAAVVPNVTFTLKVGRRVERWHWFYLFHLIRKATLPFKIPADSLYFIDQNCHMVTPGCKGNWKSGCLSRNLVDLIKIGVPFTRKEEWPLGKQWTVSPLGA